MPGSTPTSVPTSAPIRHSMRGLIGVRSATAEAESEIVKKIYHGALTGSGNAGRAGTAGRAHMETADCRKPSAQRRR